MTENKYATITFAKADELNDYADYGFQSYNEKPTHKRNIKVSAKARDEIEKIRTELNETQSEFCGRILSEAVQSDYKPLAKSVHKNFKIQMDHEASVCAMLRESDNTKLDKLAESLGLKPGDYMRLTLYAALKGWKNAEH